MQSICKVILAEKPSTQRLAPHTIPFFPSAHTQKGAGGQACRSGGYLSPREGALPEGQGILALFSLLQAGRRSAREIMSESQYHSLDKVLTLPYNFFIKVKYFVYDD